MLRQGKRGACYWGGFDVARKLPNLLLPNFPNSLGSLHSPAEQLSYWRQLIFSCSVDNVSRVLFTHRYNFAQYSTWVCCLQSEAWSFYDLKYETHTKEIKQFGRIYLWISWRAASRSRMQPRNPKQNHASLRNLIMMPRPFKSQIRQKISSPTAAHVWQLQM